MSTQEQSTNRPKRRFGQNFLVDQNVVNHIIDAVGPQSDQTIIEIGPGRGALTTRLIEKARRTIAIEFDRDLVPQLRKKFAGAANLEIIEADALAINFCDVIQAPQAAHLRIHRSRL